MDKRRLQQTLADVQKLDFYSKTVCIWLAMGTLLIASFDTLLAQNLPLPQLVVQSPPSLPFLQQQPQQQPQPQQHQQQLQQQLLPQQQPLHFPQQGGPQQQIQFVDPQQQEQLLMQQQFQQRQQQQLLMQQQQQLHQQQMQQQMQQQQFQQQQQQQQQPQQQPVQFINPQQQLSSQFVLPPPPSPLLSPQPPPSSASLILQQQPPTATPRQRMYSAIFNQKGLKGTISFRQPSTISSINIVVHLHSTPDIHNVRWEIHEFPVDWTEKALCSDLGLIAPNGDLTSRHGLLSTNVRSEFQDSLLQLGSIESIWMRSVVLIASNGDRVCATIRAADDDPLVMVAIVSGRVSGEIVLMQPNAAAAAASGQLGTAVGGGAEDIHLRVLTNLFYTDGSPVRSQLAWDLRSIGSNNNNEPRGSGNGATHIVDCSRLTTRTTDLNRILGPAPVGERKSSARISISSEVLALHTLAAASGSDNHLYVVIHDTAPNGVARQAPLASATGMAISCGYLQEIKPKQVRATFAMQGVGGSLTFTQNSRWDATRIDVQLNGLRGVAGPYHIHEWPIEPIDPTSVQDNVNVCNAPFTGQHYNPHAIDLTLSPAPGQGTHDQYQIGDLGGKHGLLSGAVAFSGTFFDDNLSLFGPLSIIGRSIVLHAQQTGERFACADIGYPSRTQNAVARFEFPVKGQIIFRQPIDDNFADTTVVVSLQHAPNQQQQQQQQIQQFPGQQLLSPMRHAMHQRHRRQLPNGGGGVLNMQQQLSNRVLIGGTEHEWSIHWSPITAFNQLVTPASGRCMSAGNIVNPYSVDSQHPSYNEQCTRFVPLRCQLGDLGNKHGRIFIVGPTDLPIKSVFTDVQLPIMGPLGITSRSLVIMDGDMTGVGSNQKSRLACTNITRF